MAPSTFIPSRSESESKLQIAVVIPCYRVTAQLANVLAAIGPEVHQIICVIDGCDQGSGRVARESAQGDARIHVAEHQQNLGVGAACATGYRVALEHRADILVKLDGDGQMSPLEIAALIRPLERGDADYVKGNRFWNLQDVQNMPVRRVIGNIGLTFFSKLSSGYWNIFDPTNGFTAMHAVVAQRIPWQRLHRGYFFESDLLFHLYTLRAVVVDQPLPARYADETSGLSEWKALLSFPIYHAKNFVKRIFYCYFLRDFNLASLNLLIAICFIAFGTIFGATQWIRGIEQQQFNSAGTVMLAALPLILGWQALLSFLNFDLVNIPTRPLQRQVR